MVIFGRNDPVNKSLNAGLREMGLIAAAA